MKRISLIELKRVFFNTKTGKVILLNGHGRGKCNGWGKGDGTGHGYGKKRHKNKMNSIKIYEVKKIQRQKIKNEQ